MSKDFCLFCLYSSPLFSGILSRRDKKQTKRGKRGTSQRNICPQALLLLQCTLPSLCSRQQLCRVVLQCLHEPHLTSPHLTKLFPTVFLCCSFMLSFFFFLGKRDFRQPHPPHYRTLRTNSPATTHKTSESCAKCRTHTQNEIGARTWNLNETFREFLP